MRFAVPLETPSVNTRKFDPPLAPQVAAGSLVLKDVAPRTMVAGSPAKVVGTVEGALAWKCAVALRVFTQQAACPLPTACLLYCWR